MAIFRIFQHFASILTISTQNVDIKSIFCIEANTKCRKFLHFALVSMQNIAMSTFLRYDRVYLTFYSLIGIAHNFR